MTRPIDLADTPREVTMLLAFVFLLFVAGAAPAFAQPTPEPPASWGVMVGVTPTWKASSYFQELFLSEGVGTVEGSDFSIGFVRGRTLGGHWGIVYTRKSYQDGTTLMESSSDSSTSFSSSFTRTLVFHDVYLDGVEAVFFIPFGTIRQRFQVGLNVGGGAGFPKGTIDETFVSVTSFTPPNGQVQTQTNTDTFSAPAKDVIMSIQPLIRAEVLGAIIAAPGLKVTFGGGLNAPSNFAFSVGLVYLIGAK